jgi:hypothetical protein
MLDACGPGAHARVGESEHDHRLLRAAMVAVRPDIALAVRAVWHAAKEYASRSSPSTDCGDTLTKTTFIQRLNTSGGLAPSTGCSSAADVGRLAFVPYSADYFFYKGPEDQADAGD